jgi:hypothetical protein
MDRYMLIASEYGLYLPDSAPIFRLMQFSEFAQARREERIEAAKKGLVFVG